MIWNQAEFQSPVIVKPHADYEWRINLVPVGHLRTQKCYSAGAQLTQNKNIGQDNKTRKRNNFKRLRRKNKIIFHRWYNYLYKNPGKHTDKWLELNEHFSKATGEELIIYYIPAKIYQECYLLNRSFKVQPKL